jgi:hypothetical protein
MFPAQPMNPVRAKARTDTVLYMCKKANFIPHLTPLGKKLRSSEKLKSCYRSKVVWIARYFGASEAESDREEKK